MHTLVSPILARHKWFNLNQAIEPVLSFKALWATPKQKNGKMPTSKRERDRRLCKHLKIFSEEQTAFQLAS